MTLPDFLVVGAQRAGTTWLDARLRSHPAVYLPERRKEVHFFDRYFERGVGWYESFFPAEEVAARYGAIGEISPAYLFEPDVPERIRRVVPECRIVAILRDPVDRAYSQYGLAVRDLAEDRSFEAYLRDHPRVLERGRYSVQLERYLERFPRERIFVGLFEEMVEDPGTFFPRLARFLEVDPAPLAGEGAHGGDRGREAGPGASDGTEKRHASYRPRFPRARALARRVGGWLRRRDRDGIVEAAKSLGVGRLFGRAGELSPMDEDTRRELRARYEPEVRYLEALLDRDVSDAWWGRREG